MVAEIAEIAEIAETGMEVAEVAGIWAMPCLTRAGGRTLRAGGEPLCPAPGLPSTVEADW
ncbi:hypothetical protein GCM10010335_36990 [Streptomyces galbus]|nr:hypothetical protein GCM10010335_36990 [Streptomyces galbus]